MLCVLLHFYQPSNQLPDVFRDVVKSCYAPLIKVIKNNKKLCLTANMPLAFLEQLDKFAYHDLLADVKLLVEQERIELTGTGAYHPLLTKLPEITVQRQVILNELAYAYYFGADKDFEGEDCYMIKDVKGFFPPEMAVHIDLVKWLATLGYEWVLVDEFSLPEDTRRKHKNGVFYSVNSCSTKVLVRNRGLSNLLAFNRSFDVSAIAGDLLTNGENAILAMDAETFGHHYKDGVIFFDNLALELEKCGMEFFTLSQALKFMEERPLSGILESTWSTVDSDIYSMWVNKESSVNSALWDLFHTLHGTLEISTGDFVGSDSQRHGQDVHSNVPPTPLWLDSACPTKENEFILNLMKSEQSDAFWWSTGAKIDGKVNMSRYMVLSVLEYYKKVAGSLTSGSDLIREKIAEVENRAEYLE